MKTKLLLSLFLLSLSFASAQITLNETLTPQEMAEDILMDNTSFTISNVEVISGSDFGFDNSIAAFEVDSSVFPFSGLTLASGDITNIVGPSSNSSSDGGWPGDADLEEIVDSFNTNDATAISFDFITEETQLDFGVIFASEEYDQNFECVFADAFAMILTNTATNESLNIANVPDTTAPITTVNVRPEVPNSCEAANPEYFGFYNFSPFNDPAESIISFDGQTTIIPVTAAIEASVIYHLKIVIADDTDTTLNSSIFIKQGNFAIDNDVDNLSDLVEDRNQNGNFEDDDTDNDTIPNYLDSDDDGDSIPTQMEVFATINGVLQRNIIDTDGDDIENYLDDDDDGDGTLTINEDYNNNGDFLDDDLNGNGVPDYLDAEVNLSVDSFELSGISMYPNPVINEVTISNAVPFSTITVYNLQGQKVLSYAGTESTEHDLNLSQVDRGIYFISIDSSKNSFKLIKN